MPRANNRRRDDRELDLRRVLGGIERREQHADGEWFVRSVSGAAGAKTYRCPGCAQLVRAGTPHLVTWPADGPWSHAGALDARRHWHTGCWTARSRRR